MNTGMNMNRELEEAYRPNGVFMTKVDHRNDGPNLVFRLGYETYSTSHNGETLEVTITSKGSIIITKNSGTVCFEYESGEQNE